MTDQPNPSQYEQTDDYGHQMPDPDALQPAALAWSIPAFGAEPLTRGLERLAKNGVGLAELPGNRFGPDVGYDIPEIKKELSDFGIQTAGIWGMFSFENSIASRNPYARQRGVDYIKRNLEMAVELRADYFLIVPGTPGETETDPVAPELAAETLKRVEYLFEDSGVKGCFMPMRAGESSFCHTLAEALDFLKVVGSNGIQHLSPDIYALMGEESDLYELLKADALRFINLHIADSNRRGLGTGVLDLQKLILALATGSFGGYITFNPVPDGEGGNPYALYDAKALDELVKRTVETWREAEGEVIADFKPRG
ncbi:sugar phosphate isomerase/epimerase family protein [Planctomycetota bacterium]